MVRTLSFSPLLRPSPSSRPLAPLQPFSFLLLILTKWLTATFVSMKCLMRGIITSRHQQEQEHVPSCCCSFWGEVRTLETDAEILIHRFAFRPYVRLLNRVQPPPQVRQGLPPVVGILCSCNRSGWWDAGLQIWRSREGNLSWDYAWRRNGAVGRELVIWAGGFLLDGICGLE